MSSRASAVLFFTAGAVLGLAVAAPVAVIAHTLTRRRCNK